MVRFPQNLIVTSDRPDIVIIDDTKKKVDIFELTVPIENNMELRHEEKTRKYSYFERDIDTYQTKVTLFEIGSRGYISNDNEQRLKKIHRFCRKNITFKCFKRNICKLVVRSPYYIFISRKEFEWSTPPYMKP